LVFGIDFLSSSPFVLHRSAKVPVAAGKISRFPVLASSVQVTPKALALASSDYDLKKKYDDPHIQRHRQDNPERPPVICNT
jgi:hypothetical protein